MKRRNPPHVHEYENQHGATVYYLRRPGHKKVRLRIPDGLAMVAVIHGSL
jgi:hypothetical protein